MPFSDLATAWDPAPAVLVGAGVSLLLFGRAFRRLRSRGRRDLAGWDRAALFLLAVAAFVLALVSPLDATGDEFLLSAHMLQHALLLDVAPALALLALRGPLLLFVLPRPVLRLGTRLEPLHRLLRPRSSFAAWAAAVAGWHVPAAYDCALAHAWVHDLEHASFLVAGLLVWSQLVDPARRRALSTAQRAGFALALFAAGHAVLHPLFFASGPLYAAYETQPHRLLGLSPLADQHYAAIVMTVDQALVLGTFLAVLLRHPSTSRARRTITTAAVTPAASASSAANTRSRTFIPPPGPPAAP